MNSRLHSCRAFTLIEALLALAVSVLVIGIAYTAYHTIVTVRHGLDSQENSSLAAMQALQDISRDLMCGAALNSNHDPVFSLTAPSAGAPGSQITFCTASPGNNTDAPLTWYSLERITCYLQKNGHNNLQLIRENTPLLGKKIQNTQTNILLDHVTDFQASVYYNGEWTPEWAPTPDVPWPQAARIAVSVYGESELYSTDVFLPVGNMITSSVNRTSIQTAGE